MEQPAIASKDVATKVAACEVACQTDGKFGNVPLPLPLQYPTNLIYAQNMLAITVSQLHQVELNTAQLRLYMREHQLLRRDASASCSSGAAQPTANQNAQAAAGGAAQAEGAAGGGAAGAPGGDAGRQDVLDLRRRRFLVAVRVTLVLLALGVKLAWFLLAFFFFFLYLADVFDPLINWLQRSPAQATLEEQLAAMRRRQANAAMQQQQGGAGPADAASTAASGSQQQSGTGAANGQQGGQAEEAGGLGGETTTSPDGTGAGAADPAEGGGAGGQEGHVPGGPTYRQRFIYQLIVMFFMTLLPWWNPDPRYL